MKQIGQFVFPSEPLEAIRWRPLVVIEPLSQCVLAVAKTRIEGAWSAYVDAVPGYYHEAEADAVMSRGAKLPEPVARAVFPQFKDVPYAP